LINFVSNLPYDLRTGGFSAMNVAAWEAVSRIDEVSYIGPIDPRPIRWQKAVSKLKRTLGARGDFFFFSRRRLEAIAEEVQAHCSAEARLDFFHGFTPWILTKPPRPYVAWSDCTFRDYISIFHDRTRFDAFDLERIERAEASWLSRASRILFSTDWAAKRAICDYGLDPVRVGVTGIFGELVLPERDSYNGGRDFAFVATNFAAKGGHTVLAAFRKLRDRYPDLSLTVVGERPEGLSDQPGVRFTGFLRKENPRQYEEYCRILSQARALVHPTRSDVAPLIVVEAAYFGCPAISSRMFAIPELIDDRASGILLDDPGSVDELHSAMHWVLEYDDHYRRMRKAAWDRARSEHSKARHGALVANAIRETLSEPLAATQS
jgi:glycosyltransferase involved in cell wall biosynthesis